MTDSPGGDSAGRREGGALFLSVLFHPTVGGSIRWIEKLCRDVAGGRVTVLTREIEGASREVRGAPYAVERVPLRTHPWLRPESLLLYRNLDAAALSLARRERPSVLVAARVVPEGLVALRVRRRVGVPFIVLAHGEEIAVPARSRRRPLTRLAKLAAMRRVYRCADLVVANSENTARLVREFAGEDVHAAVLHPGVDPERFRPDGEDLRGSLGVADRRVLLTVGTLMPRKGQSAALEALPEVRRAVPDVVYLVAGDGPDAGRLRERAQALALGDSVRLLGAFPDERLPSLYRTADLFVLANRNLPDGDLEGFGIVYLEAAASGLPVIVGAPAGNSEAVVEGVTAIRADPEDPAALAAAIVGLMRDRARASEMGREGRAFVLDRFSPARLSAEWNRLLDVARGRLPEAAGGG
jgi:phosphatidylinositol alpha-1,6-mannosyltransferase